MVEGIGDFTLVLGLIVDPAGTVSGRIGDGDSGLDEREDERVRECEAECWVGGGCRERGERWIGSMWLSGVSAQHRKRARHILYNLSTDSFYPLTLRTAHTRRVLGGHVVDSAIRVDFFRKD